MTTNWHDLRDAGNDRARAAILSAQAQHRADRLAGTVQSGGLLQTVRLALRFLFGGTWATHARRAPRSLRPAAEAG